MVAIAQALAFTALGEAGLAAQSALEAAQLGLAAGSVWQAISHKGTASFCTKLRGHLREAWRLSQEVLDLAQDPAHASDGILPPGVSQAYGLRANVLLEWNQLDAAEELVLQGIELGEQAGLLSTIDVSYAALGSIYLVQGKVEEATAAIARAEQVDGQLHNPHMYAMYVRNGQVRLWLKRGELERAKLWAEELRRTPRLASPLAREREDVAVVRILLAQEKPEEALLHLNSLLEMATKQERWEYVIEMLL